MKLAVFSDSHGSNYHMMRAVYEYGPDLILHLGDYGRDTAVLEQKFPHTPIRAVRGNCDFASAFPERQVFSAGPVTVFMTHGHLYNVKLGLEPLLNAGHFSGAGLVLFGHTHTPLLTEAGGMRVVNPGSIGTGIRLTWAKIEISDTGDMACEIAEA